MAGPVRCVVVWRVELRCGRAGEVSSGMYRIGQERLGLAGEVGYGR